MCLDDKAHDTQLVYRGDRATPVRRICHQDQEWSYQLDHLQKDRQNHMPQSREVKIQGICN